MVTRRAVARPLRAQGEGCPWRHTDGRAAGQVTQVRVTLAVFLLLTAHAGIRHATLMTDKHYNFFFFERRCSCGRRLVTPRSLSVCMWVSWKRHQCSTHYTPANQRSEYLSQTGVMCSNVRVTPNHMALYVPDASVHPGGGAPRRCL